MPETISPTVANHHSRIASPNANTKTNHGWKQSGGNGRGQQPLPWPTGEEALGRSFEQYLEATALDRDVRLLILWGVKLAFKHFRVNPCDLTLATLPRRFKALAMLSATEWNCARAGLRHWAVFMMNTNHWPQTFDREWIRPHYLLAHLPAEWRAFLDRAWRDWRQGTAKRPAVAVWRRLVTGFIWWHRLPPGGPFAGEELLAKWNDYLLALLNSSQQELNQRMAPRRALTALLYALNKTGWMPDAPLPCRWIVPSFWSPLERPIRRAAERLIPLSLATPAGELRPFMLRYVLHYGFNYLDAAPRGQYTPTAKEFSRVRAWLKSEQFVPETIENVMRDVRHVLELARSMKSGCGNAGRKQGGQDDGRDES